MGKWILACLAFPIIDLYLLVQLGKAYGGVLALRIALGGVVVGITLARVLGLRQLRGWQAQLAQGRAPSQNVLDGLLVLLACVCFVLPGVLSDALALLLLIPPIRRWIAARAKAQLFRAIERGTLHVNFQNYGPIGRREAEPEGVIDVEGEEVQPAAPSGGTRKSLP